MLVAALGIDSEGFKHPLGLMEGATEHSAVVQALIDDLIERGLEALVEQLNSCIASTLVDSPIFQLIEGMQPPPIDHKRADLFRERIAKLEEIKGHLSAARAGEKIESIDSIAESLGDVSELEAGVVIDM